jgi:hypothetical protein
MLTYAGTRTGNNACETAPLLLAYSDSHFVPLVYHLQDCPQEVKRGKKRGKKNISKKSLI